MARNDDVLIIKSQGTKLQRHAINDRGPLPEAYVRTLKIGGEFWAKRNAARTVERLGAQHLMDLEVVTLETYGRSRHV